MCAVCVLAEAIRLRSRWLLLLRRSARHKAAKLWLSRDKIQYRVLGQLPWIAIKLPKDWFGDGIEPSDSQTAL